jgi:hypothetical protein
MIFPRNIIIVETAFDIVKINNAKPHPPAESEFFLCPLGSAAFSAPPEEGLRAVESACK